MERPARFWDISADASLIVPGDLRAELAAVLAAFERATGLQTCFRPMTDRWRGTDGAWIVGEPFVAHRSPFCTTVKTRAPTACWRCDNTELPSACAPAEGLMVDPFVRTCHAGADEILLPLWSEGALVAVLFVGQFVGPDRGQAPEPLRRMSEPELAQVRTLAVAMRGYLQDLLRKLEAQRHERASGRRGAIEGYVRERLLAGPTLTELAARLSLSPSRAGHAVREVTGRSFQQLVEERRIAVAKDLLASTDGTISWVAAQAGFNDVGYFCRYFKRKTGTTAGAFRKRHRPVLPV